MSSPPAAPSLARGAASVTVATALSRLTGFVRVVVVAATMGTTYLANTYQTANTAPNLVFELLAAGVLTSIFVPTFVQYLVGDRRAEGWEAANALGSVALVGLAGLSIVLALAAPLVMRVLTLGVTDPGLRTAEIELGSRFLRLFAPQVALYGVGMIMTAALHAHRRFFLASVAPIFNNVVVIGVYLTYGALRGDAAPSVKAITDTEVLVLGLGTTLGVLAMTVALVPQLLRLGWRIRWRFDLRHAAVRRGARVGAWALGYAGGYQLGLIVVLMLANAIQGGVAAYQWAYTFFYMPHALFAVPIFNVLFTVMSEHVARNESEGLVERMRDGLGMLAFILVPIAAALVVVAQVLARVTLEFGVMSDSGAALVGRVLASFAIGLPAYSAFLVFTRAFYARGDARTPALVNAGTVAVSSAVGAALFTTLPGPWRVPGLALGHSIAFILGSIVLGRIFSRRAGAFGGTRLNAATVRIAVGTVFATGAMATVTALLPEATKGEALVDLVATTASGAFVYLLIQVRMRSPELARLRRVVRPG